MASLSSFELSDLVALSAELRRLGERATDLDDVAGRVASLLFDRLRAADGTPELALARVYSTRRYCELDRPAREQLRRTLGGRPAAATPCLALSGTAGAQPEWGARHSCGFPLAVPVPGPDSSCPPLLAELMQRLGVPAGGRLDAAPLERRSTYGVVHVPVAAGSPRVPEQELVRRHGVASALAFGGLLPAGELFAVLLLSTRPVDPTVARRFGTLALAVEVAILPFASNPARAPAGRRRLRRAAPWRAPSLLPARVAALEHLLGDQERVAGEQAHRLELAYAREHESAERNARLVEVSRALGAALTPEEVADTVFTRVFPLLGVRVGNVGLVDEAAGVLRLLGPVFLGRPGEQTGGVPLSAPAPVTTTARLGVPLQVADRAEAARRFPSIVPGLERHGCESLITMPLSSRGRVFGALSLAFAERRDLSQAEGQFLATVAAICGQALHRAQLFVAERAGAATLQRSLLPHALPPVAGAALAARYRTSGRGADVGGDWYDAIPLPGGAVGLVVGDVEGHDLAAAALMGQVRSVVRAYALQGHPPSVVLRHTNGFLHSLELDRFVTLTYLQVHGRERIATVASAGHMPPLLLRDGDGEGFIEVEQGLPLGVDPGAGWREMTMLLPPGSVVALYSNGLLERRGEPLDAGMRRLQEAAASFLRGARAHLDLEAVADQILRLAGDAASAVDDVAVLLLQLTQSGPVQHSVRRRLPAAPVSAPIARWFLADLLRAWDAGEVADTAELLVSEVVSNAARHSEGDVELRVELRGERLRVEVSDTSHRQPVLPEQRQDATSGRGLFLVEALSAEWGVEPDGLGKMVWFELAVEDTAPLSA